MYINEKKFKFVMNLCANVCDPQKITVKDLQYFIRKNSFVIFHTSILYKTYKDKHLLDLIESARENKRNLEELNIVDIEEISKCCHKSIDLYLQFKFFKKEFERYETYIL